MSKNTMQVRVHYGQKNFNDVLKNILKVKLEEIDEKNHNHKHTITGYHKEIKE